VVELVSLCVRVEPLLDLANSSSCCLIARIAIDTSAQRTECDALATILCGQVERAAVARLQQAGVLALFLSAPVDRTDSVDDLLAWQFVAISDLGVACVTTVESFAFAQKSSASCAVDGAVDTSSTVSGV
jgi:hypothetical protein